MLSYRVRCRSWAIISWSSCSVNNPIRNHDFRHSSNSIDFIFSLVRWSLIVCFAPENTRSSSDDIAGILYISIAILDRKGSRVCYSSRSHQSRAVWLSRVRFGSLRYRSSSSVSSYVAVPWRPCSQTRNSFFRVSSTGAARWVVVIFYLYIVSQKSLNFSFISGCYDGSQLSKYLYFHIRSRTIAAIYIEDRSVLFQSSRSFV